MSRHLRGRALRRQLTQAGLATVPVACSPRGGRMGRLADGGDPGAWSRIRRSCQGVGATGEALVRFVNNVPESNSMEFDLVVDRPP